MKKIFSILFALVLVMSLGLASTAPVVKGNGVRAGTQPVSPGSPTFSAERR